MPSPPAVRGSSSSDLDRALTTRGGGAGPVAHFLHDVAPGQVVAGVQQCLPGPHPDALLHLVRAKLKPGRKLTAEYDVLLPAAAVERRVAVTWVTSGATAPGPAVVAEADARRRRVLAPFTRSWWSSDDGRASLSLAPVDGAFPQLVRLHDRRYVLDRLRATGLARDAVGAGIRDVAVRTVRYRPGQRHVLRIGLGAGGPAWFAKVYRDDTGRHAVTAAARSTAALAAAGGAPAAASSGAGAYLAEDRVAVWPEVAGLTLAELLVLAGPGAGGADGDLGGLLRTAGAALRCLHDTAPATGLPSCPDAVTHVATTLRTAEVVDALLPVAGALVRAGAARALEALATLPGEAPTTVHGDFKSDNILAGMAGVHLLDFDRSGCGDPAVDIGNFLADLRWHSDGDGAGAAALQEAFLAGYGSTAPARLARARVYDGLFLLRMAARRYPVSAPDREHEVTRAIEVAVAALAGACPP
jgi:Phosphotransferase enzyme family